MTVTLTLTPELELFLAQKASREGLSLESYTSQLLSDYLLPQIRRAELVNLLQSWIDRGEIDEQQETGEYIIRAIDEDRLSERKLFPDELKGVSW